MTYEQMADRIDDEIIHETIREGSSQYWNDDEGNEDPNRYLNAEENVEGNAEGTEEGNEKGNAEGTEEGNEEQPDSQSQPSVGKRARGQRGPARKIEGCHVITGVGEDGCPNAPTDAARNYVSHCGGLFGITSPST